MSKFERISEKLRKEWGLQLHKGSADFGHGFSTGYIVIGRRQIRFNTLKEIERSLLFNCYHLNKANLPIK